MRRFLISFFLFAMMMTFISVASAEPPGNQISTVVASSHRPVSSRDWDAKTRILLAQSCVGEAKFDAFEECMAIAWCYAKRAKKVGWPLYKMIQRYSAAVKPHDKHSRPWLFELNAKATEPKSWPPNLSWDKYKRFWRKMLSSIDRWQAGFVPDPQPDSDHFGSRADARRAYHVMRWKRLDTPDYINWFFDSTKKNKFVPERVNAPRNDLRNRLRRVRRVSKRAI